MASSVAAATRRTVDRPCKRCGGPNQAGRNGLRVSRDNCPDCARKVKADRNWLKHQVRKPRKEAEPKLRYGKEFQANARFVRQCDNRTCVRCSKYPAAIVDHIFPLRLLEGWAKKYGDDPHSIENLWTLCQSCSGIKTGIDKLAKESNFTGFALAMRAFCGDNDPMRNRFISSVKHYHISVFWVG